MRRAGANDTLPDTFVRGHWRKMVDASLAFGGGMNTMMDL
jgi:hypothetical protein